MSEAEPKPVSEMGSNSLAHEWERLETLKELGKEYDADRLAEVDAERARRWAKSNLIDPNFSSEMLRVLKTLHETGERIGSKTTLRSLTTRGMVDEDMAVTPKGVACLAYFAELHN